jgi:Kyanoviridae head maturation protease
MKLITEILDSPLTLLEEGEGANKKQFLEGIFMQGGIPNKNKRIYPIDILQKEATRFMTENISKNRAYGELNHPEGPSINLDRVAVHIKNLRQEGNNFIGKAQIASTPMGDCVKGLLSDGANLGVSTRALGSLKPISEGLNEVQSDLRLLAIDVVADPSAPDAYVNGIFENRDYIYDPIQGTVLETKIKAVKRMTMDEIERSKFSLLESFFRKLSQ